MDPFSIATGAISVAAVGIKVAAFLYEWVEGVKNADSAVNNLHGEVTGLSRVLESISKAVKEHAQVLVARVGPEAEVWDGVKVNMDSCGSTLGLMLKNLESIKRKDRFVPRFLRRSSLHLKLTLSNPEISTYRQQVQSHYSAMQSALQIIGICLLFRSNSSQEAILLSLNGLNEHLQQMDKRMLAFNETQSTALEATKGENERIYKSLKQFIDVASSFHSNASTVVSEGRRSTVYGGSVDGAKLSTDRMKEIENWLPTLVAEEEEEPTEASGSDAQQFTSVTSNPTGITEPSSNYLSTPPVEPQDLDGEFDLNTWYRITNASFGPSKSLDMLNTGDPRPKHGFVHLEATGFFSGQLWRLKPYNGEKQISYTISSKFLGATLRLEAGDTGPMLLPAREVPSQQWIFNRWDDGTWRIHNLKDGPDLRLDVAAVDPPRLFMGDGNYTSQHWSFTPLSPIDD